MEYVFLIIFIATVTMYLLDRKGWHATGKRLTTIVRANIEGSKPVAAIEKKSEKLELDKWTSEFEGKQLDAGLKHEIAKTWFARVGGTVYPHWKCKCTYSDWEVSLESAHRKSKRHVKEQNDAEILLARNGGTRAW